MTPQRKRRLVGALLILFGVGIAAVLAAVAFRNNLLFFFTPTQIAEGEAPVGQTFRVGGLVVPGSLRRGNSLAVHFEVTDTAERVEVHYEGILPDLFEEGQGVVAKGRLRADGVFYADEVLAKHDENYMPPEVAEALERSGTGHPGASKR